MGTGIMAAIPIVFKPYERRTIDPHYFSKDFFNNYNVSETDGKPIYTIKESLLINNYKTFVTEFYDLIDELAESFGQQSIYGTRQRSDEGNARFARGACQLG